MTLLTSHTLPPTVTGFPILRILASIYYPLSLFDSSHSHWDEVIGLCRVRLHFPGGH